MSEIKIHIFHIGKVCVAPVDWDAVLLSGIADDRAAQKKSLAWIRAQSRERNCVACIANHDSDVKPGAITL